MMWQLLMIKSTKNYLFNMLIFPSPYWHRINPLPIQINFAVQISPKIIPSTIKQLYNTVKMELSKNLNRKAKWLNMRWKNDDIDYQSSTTATNQAGKLVEITKQISCESVAHLTDFAPIACHYPTSSDSKIIPSLWWVLQVVQKHIDVTPTDNAKVNINTCKKFNIVQLSTL